MQLTFKITAYSALVITFLGAGVAFIFGLIFALLSGVGSYWEFDNATTGFGLLIFGQVVGYSLLALGSLGGMSLSSVLLMKLYKMED